MILVNIVREIESYLSSLSGFKSSLARQEEWGMICLCYNSNTSAYSSLQHIRYREAL